MERILAATLTLINELDYDSITTNHIAREAKIGIGTVYRNFPLGKDEIISNIVERNINDILFLRDFTTGESMSPSSFLLQFFTDFVQNHRKKYRINLAFQKSFISNKQLYSDFETKIKTKIKESLPLFRIKLKIPTKSQDTFSAKIYHMYNIVEAIVHRHIYEIPITDSDEELVEYLVDIATVVFKRSIETGGGNA